MANILCFQEIVLLRGYPNGVAGKSGAREDIAIGHASGNGEFRGEAMNIGSESKDGFCNSNSC